MTAMERLAQQIAETKRLANTCRDKQVTPRLQAVSRNLAEILESMRRVADAATRRGGVAP